MNLIDSKRRGDIDGLRAIAVIIVAVFHFDSALLPGGYVGVDAFFVISGYLITSKIVELDGSLRQLSRFFLRRAIRLMPAFLTTAVFFVAFGLLYLSPTDLNSLGRSILAALFFHSNFHFMKSVDYFAEGTHDPFMLHTWSLSVEWQFYFVLPFVFFFFRKLLRVTAQSSLWICMAFAILAGGLSFWAYEPETYFSPAYRAWEFMVGGVLSQLKQPADREKRLAPAFVSLGIALLLVASLLKFSPGRDQLAQIVLACLGSGLLLRFGAEKNSISRALAWYPISLVGLASYSIYLVHYPLLGAIRHIGYNSTALPSLSFYLVLVVAAGIVQWKLVEQSSQSWFRSRSSARSWAALGATLATAGLITGAVVLTRGLPGRLNAELASHQATSNERRLNARLCPSVSPELVRLGQSCIIGTSKRLSKAVVWGDSHALALVHPLERIAIANDVAIRGFFRPACPPLLGVRRIGAGQAEPCHEASHAFVEAMAKASDVETVVIHARWAYWAEGHGFSPSERQPAVLIDGNTQSQRESNNRTLFRAALQRTIDQLRLHGKRVILLGPVPEMLRHLPNELINAGLVTRTAIDSVERSTFNKRQDFVLDILNQQKSYDVQILMPHDVICTAANCMGVRDGKALYYDDNHLSQEGALTLQPMLAGGVVW